MKTQLFNMINVVNMYESVELTEVLFNIFVGYYGWSQVGMYFVL